MKGSKFSTTTLIAALTLMVVFIASSFVTSSAVVDTPDMELVALQGIKEDMSLQTPKRHQMEKELGISLAGNVLVFKTIEDYRRAVDNPTEEMSNTVRAAVKSYSKFQSYSDSKGRVAKPAFNDEYFESMLNSDQVVQISGHLFRVNPNTNKVFVLSSSKINEYKDLVAENLSNKSISVYSTDEDVLDLVTGNALNQKPLICHEGGVGGDASSQKFKIGNTNYETLASFTRYGIYFSLFAEVKPSAGKNQFLFEFDNGFGYIHWHARCGLTADYGTTSSGNDNFGSNKQRYQSYQGSKNLANFFLGTEFC